MQQERLCGVRREAPGGARLELPSYNTRFVFWGVAKNVFSVSEPLSPAPLFVLTCDHKCLEDIYVVFDMCFECLSSGPYKMCLKCLIDIFRREKCL